VSALNKYWQRLTTDEAMMMTLPEINEAVAVSGFPKEVTEWVWEKNRQPFEVY
jgi:hypothetical protein